MDMRLAISGLALAGITGGAAGVIAGSGKQDTNAVGTVVAGTGALALALAAGHAVFAIHGSAVPMAALGVFSLTAGIAMLAISQARASAVPHAPAEPAGHPAPDIVWPPRTPIWYA